MKFLLAADNFTRGSGGAPRSAQELVRGLLGAGHQVAVIEAGRRDGRTDWSGAELHRVRLHGPLLPADRDLRTVVLNPRWRERVAELAAGFGPDLVVTQGMFAPGAISAAHRAGLPAAYFFRGYAPFCPRQYMGLHPETDCRRPDCWRCLSLAQHLKYPLVRGALDLYKATLPRAELVVANSRYVAALFERFWGVHAEVILPTGGLAPAARPENDPGGYLLFIKPQKIKGLDLILELARRMPERRFAVAGETRGAARRRLSRLSNIRLLGWCDDMPAVYRGARLLLGPSLWHEPFGRVFAEAASVGCPSVAFRCGGIPEAAGAGGVLLERAAGPDEWLRAIRGLDDPGRYEALRGAALAHARELAGYRELTRAVGLLEAAARRGRGEPRAPADLGRKLRVVHVISALPLGGAELSTFHLTSRLDRRLFEVSVICTREEGELAAQFREAGVPVELVKLPSRYGIPGLSRLTRRLRELGADVVHTQMRRANTSGRIAAWMAGVPVIVAHERNLPHDKNWRHFLVDRLLARISSCVIAVSPQVAEAEAAAGGTPRRKLLALPNALDLSVFKPGDRTAARTALGLPADDFVVGFAGRLHENKNLDVLLAAAAEAAGEISNLRIALAGEGPEQAALERQAAELGISARVTFLGVRKDMPKVYPAMDALGLISKVEGCSRTLLEATACGIPAIATPVGYAPELLGRDEAGILVPLRDAGAAARAMVRLAREPETRARMGRVAQERAAANGIDDYVRRVERLYLDLWAEAHAKK